MTDERQVLVEARGVSHEFTQPNGQRLRVLDGITLQIRTNEVVALLGPSGCGKSTILRILAGLIRPTQGQALRRGQPMAGVNDEVALVFQGFALCPWMRAGDNIRAVLTARGLDRDAADAQVAEVIRLVGLGGFANAYPRELSGGMKQRIGIARAIAVDRPLLFMDEPFSQVDALTAESLRSEVLDLWAPKDRNPAAVVMVSHDIKEVVYMADRIVVLGANPGRIRTIVDNALPRPRDYRSAEFGRLVDQIHNLITGHEMPDAPPAPAPAPTLPMPPEPIEALPAAMPSEIVGLVEYLAARGGTDDVFRVSSDTGREFGTVIAIVKAAEMLDLVDTPKRLVTLTTQGRKFADAGAEERLRLWREQLDSLRLFHEVHALVARQPTHELNDDIVRETIVFSLPHEDYERQFTTLVAWARYGQYLAHDDAREAITMPNDIVAGSSA